MEIKSIKTVEYHPYPEYGMMMVTCDVVYNGITEDVKEFYVPCIEIRG